MGFIALRRANWSNMSDSVVAARLGFDVVVAPVAAVDWEMVGKGGATGGSINTSAFGGADAARAVKIAGDRVIGLVELGRLVHASSSNPLAEVRAELLRGGRSSSMRLLAAEGVATAGDDVLAIWSEALLIVARSTP